MILFLILGESILHLFGVEVEAFAVTGSLILFAMALEMILGIKLFRGEVSGKTASIVPLAFPIIAGAGTMTSLLSLKAAYHDENIIVGIFVNLLLVYLVLKSSSWLERKIEPGTIEVLQKVFGLILLAIAIKLIKTNLV